MERTKVLFLYSEVMSYTIAGLNAMVKDFPVEVHLVRWDKKKLTPFNPAPIHNIHYYLRSELSDQNLQELAIKINPSLCYLSGWMDPGYLKVAKLLRSKNIPVLAGIDNQWRGTFRQRIGCFLSPFKIKPYFSHLLVAGVYQYEFARKLGYLPDKILFNEYTADVHLFEKAFYNRKEWKKRILFVGRLNEIKGLDLLTKAFKELRSSFPDWELVIIGNGPLKDDIPQEKGIILKDFMDSNSLLLEAQEASIFCLPSRKEPWGVVIHEFASAGLPLITSNICGANTEFLKEGYNGFTFESNNINSLKSTLSKTMSLSPEKLKEMGRRSHDLAMHISPESWAANLLSILYLRHV